MKEEKQLSPRQDLLLAIEKIHIDLDAKLTELVSYLKIFTSSQGQLPASALESLGQLNDHIVLLEERYRKSYKPKAYKLSNSSLIKKRSAQVDEMVKEIRKTNKELKQAVNAAVEFNVNQEILDALDEKIEMVKTIVSLWRKASIHLNN